MYCAFADLTLESPSVVCNGYETESRLANKYIHSDFIAWLLLVKSLHSNFLLSVWILSDTVVSPKVKCGIGVVIYRGLISLNLLDHPYVLISLCNK